jgi:prolyl-tRNA editing enzyme YbaK/EbsC (Cys-tRNA(Pro) deacylase)
MNTLSPAHVQQVLDAFELGLRVEHFEESTFSSADAARAIGCELGQIVKSICLMVGGEPVLVVASGDRRVDDAAVARRFGIGRKKVKIATSEQCVEVFGYAPGGVSPVGHRTPGIPVLVDDQLARWDILHAAAGTDRDNFRLTFEQLVTITGGEVIECTRAVKVDV